MKRRVGGGKRERKDKEKKLSFENYETIYVK
jgi:hypothetical protein